MPFNNAKIYAHRGNRAISLEPTSAGQSCLRTGVRRRTRLYFAGLIILAGVLLLGSQSPAIAAARIASWNLKHLGWNNDKDLEAVASVIERFDLVALQEVMKPTAAKQLAAIVSRQSGDDWGIAQSHALGDNSYKESYAFLWRKSVVRNEGGITVYLDPGNRFAREPLSSRFTVTVDEKPLHLTLATVHITYGHHKSDRTAEIQELDEYWQWLGQTFEGKRILLGDFNMLPRDEAWSQFDVFARPAITQGASTLAHDGFANLYDNIWTDGSLPISDTGVADYPEWLGLDHETARTRVSDHAPVYIVLGKATVSAATRQKSAEASRDCIDLNRASADELDSLDHVGPSRAQAIISGRPWPSLDGLTKISGLSEARVREIERNHSTCPF
jgi:endonuclease/exonuclease/phosphatase family metal-dependent hydrolase